MENKPNKVNIQKWVDALRSGKFIQGYGRLMRSGCHCCLGVVEDIRREEQNVPKLDYNQGQYPFFTQETQDWLGMPSKSPLLKIPSDEVRQKCAQAAGKKTIEFDEASPIAMNDNYRLSFAEIADAIELTYLKENTNG